MTQDEKHICKSIINYRTSRQIMTKMINHYPDEVCGLNAKYFENGEWYCGKHAPSKIKEREDKAFLKWEQRRVKNE